MKTISGLTGFARKVGTVFVRCADLMIYLPGDPSTKVLGYFHLVRCADANYKTFRAKSV